MLALFKELLDNPDVSDAVLQYYLDLASDIICDRRNSDVVESKFENIQVSMAIELFNKRGAEGQLAHSENGISRTYSTSDVSETLLSKVPQIVVTPYSEVRTI